MFQTVDLVFSGHESFSPYDGSSTDAQKTTPGIKPSTLPPNISDWKWYIYVDTYISFSNSKLREHLVFLARARFYKPKKKKHGIYYWHTVDGQNPAPPRMMNISLLYFQVFILPRWCGILSNGNLPVCEIQQHQPGPLVSTLTVSRMAMERSKAQSEPSDDISRPQPVRTTGKIWFCQWKWGGFPLENWSHLEKLPIWRIFPEIQVSKN